jgi:arylsulfatase A-like enzyme
MGWNKHIGRIRSAKIVFCLFIICLVVSSVNAQETLPRPIEPFGGVVERNASDSKEWWPPQIEPPKDAPNILLIMTDDVGFGASNTFGGPVPTPTLDRLAKSGLRYNTFHTTALCSPTRAALITGRNHHSAHTGTIMEFATGYPGYDSLMAKNTVTIGEILRQNGYNTAWFGKNHNVPDWQHSLVGPFDLWPTGLGFEYFYGFIGGDTNQWQPSLYEGTQPVEPYIGNPKYILNEDLADKAISWIKQQKAIAPHKPFFVYYTPGATHAPHHVPKEWIEKHKGKFDHGWDRQREITWQKQKDIGVIPSNAKLTPRPGVIPSWDTLSPDAKKLAARMMEVYAAYLEHTDYTIGRVIKAIEEIGELNNTLVIYIQGDNGASVEGTHNGTLNELRTMTLPTQYHEGMGEMLAHIDTIGSDRHYNHYPVGWAHAMNTPFQWAKQVASHFGGTRNNFVIFWPKRITDKGGLREQFHHVIDIVPTILEVIGIPAPVTVNGVTQKPIEGTSMLYTFEKKNTKAPSRHKIQYFEMFANRALYNDGWIASTTPKRLPWDMVKPMSKNPADDYSWELYNLNEDFSQANDLAKKYPQKLKELQDLFWIEAAKYNVLPLDDRFIRGPEMMEASLTGGRTKFIYPDGFTRLPEANAPDIRNKSFIITAEVEVPQNGGEGILVTMGGRFGGYGLYVKDNKPVFFYNALRVEKVRWAGNEKLSPGRHTISFDFAYDGGGMGRGGIGRFLVDGKKVDEKRIGFTVPKRFSIDETFDVGSDTGTPVSDEYIVPFRFTGTLKGVTIELKPTADAKKISR